MFFSYVDDDSQKDYISKISNQEEGIMAAEKIVKTMSKANDNWYAQNSRYIAECDRNTGIYNAHKQGVSEGIQQKAIEAAKNLLKEGDSPEKVSRCIGLTLEQVLELQKSIFVKA